MAEASALLRPQDTERLEFRLWRPSDVALATLLWGNPQVTRLFSREPLSGEQVRARLATEVQNQERLGYQYWPMFEPDTDTLVGACGLKPTGEPSVLEMGYHLLPDHWGRGLATEGGRSVVRFGFDVAGAGALQAGHHPDNHPSGRVLQKLGFRVVGRELFEPTGLIHPQYRLTRKERGQPSQGPHG